MWADHIYEGFEILLRGFDSFGGSNWQLVNMSTATALAFCNLVGARCL